MKVTDASSGSGKWYYYEKNLQGDIVGIMNADGYKVVSYSYDAWGVPYAPVYSTDSVVSAADKANAELNPFRYRGYYYDSETGYYYLQTRYYNPEWGRFINADGYINANGDILGYNMFAYCGNNPVSFIDFFGDVRMPFNELKSPGEIHQFVVTSIAKKYKWEAEYNLGSYGRADLVDTDHHMVYEVKPVSYMYTPVLFFRAMSQLERYCRGLTAEGEHEYKIGTDIISEKDLVYEDYLVSYWSNGAGLIFYYFRRDPSKEKATVPVIAPAPKRSRKKSPNAVRVGYGVAIGIGIGLAPGRPGYGSSVNFNFGGGGKRLFFNAYRFN